MSKEEIKYEINKVLDQLPDKTLQEILTFLKSVGSEQAFSVAGRFRQDTGGRQGTS